MALNFKFIPQVADKSKIELSEDQIPQDIRDGMEEVYKALKSNPGRMRIDFDTPGDRAQFLRHAKAYCKIKGYYFRVSPSAKVEGQHFVEFRVTDPPADNGTEAINNAVEEVKEATEAPKKTTRARASK